jgi:hypothetical protein
MSQSICDYFINFFTRLIAYTYLPKKPFLNLGEQDKLVLSPTI